MKKLVLAILLLCFICGFGCVRAEEAYVSLNLSDSTKKIEINVSDSRQIPGTENEYDYSSVSGSEIEYLIYYLNSLTLENADKPATVNDAPIYYINVYGADGNITKISAVYNSLSVDNGILKMVYNCDYEEIKDFLSFVKRLKNCRDKISDKTTFLPSDWAKDNIDFAVDSGILKRYFAVDFQSDITREEMCQIIDKFLFKAKPDYINTKISSDEFKDTDDRSILRLKQIGIVCGKSDAEFCPYEYITREEAAAFFARLAQYVNADSKSGNEKADYADRNEISDWASENIDYLFSNNLMTGDDKGYFNPKSNITKEEIITVIVRIAENSNGGAN